MTDSLPVLHRRPSRVRRGHFRCFTAPSLWRKDISGEALAAELIDFEGDCNDHSKLES
jgi:hypothetical protein